MALNLILWDLGTKVEEEETRESESEVSVVVEDFDEAAETHAKIWNLFAKERIERHSERSSDTYTASAISNMPLLVQKIKKSNQSSLLGANRSSHAKALSPGFGSSQKKRESSIVDENVLASSKRSH